jgi:hypothetical protein
VNGTLAQQMMMMARSGSVTWNPADKSSDVTLTNGNLTATKTPSGNAFRMARANTWKSSGLFYCELVVTAHGGDTVLGICESSTPLIDSFPGNDATSYGFYELNGQALNNGVGSSYGSSWALNDVIGMAVNLSTGKIWWHQNGTYPISGNPATGANPAFSGISGMKFPTVSLYEGSNLSSITARFKAADWTYSAPSGFGEWTA